MHRFFLPAEAFQGDLLVFPAEISRQICQVLRLRPGQTVVALDNHGSEYQAELVEVSSRQVSARVNQKYAAASEPRLHLSLYLGLTQREKFEWALQKCTEIGVSVFYPVISSRTLAHDRAEVERKLPRWERILREAAEQSHRGLIPGIFPALTFSAALEKSVRESNLVLLPWEKDQSTSLSSAVRQLEGLESPRAALFIGPEGGFSDEEAAQAAQMGALAVSLGPRILRMETAAMAAAALILYSLGDMDVPGQA